MIKFITSDQTRDLRSSELRSGLDRNLCGFVGDDDEGSFHVGYFLDTELMSIATFHRQPREGFPGAGYQLRGMVTHPDYRGRGIGNQLLNFSIVYLKGQGTNYIWCNARKKACKFYQDIGFEIISKEFELPGIGPHREMYLRIS
ncbi:MAG: GNAT family N-acetyltransferase [Daejeonella sp.]|uniref:GNAT family N-acetyltransferase n=1 Tax=Daejeonella sp. TaxID=2805397 RepID=UPI003C760519